MDRGATTRELRCRCGRLMARAVRNVVELKCPRCKRIVLLVDGKLYFPEGHACNDRACPCTFRPT